MDETKVYEWLLEVKEAVTRDRFDPEDYLPLNAIGFMERFEEEQHREARQWVEAFADTHKLTAEQRIILKEYL